MGAYKNFHIYSSSGLSRCCQGFTNSRNDRCHVCDAHNSSLLSLALSFCLARAFSALSRRDSSIGMSNENHNFSLVCKLLHFFTTMDDFIVSISLLEYVREREGGNSALILPKQYERGKEIREHLHEGSIIIHSWWYSWSCFSCFETNCRKMQTSDLISVLSHCLENWVVKVGDTERSRNEEDRRFRHREEFGKADWIVLLITSWK